MRILTFFFLLALSVRGAYAQEDSTQQTAPQVLVETKDGAQYVGRLIKQDKDRVILQTESVGVLEISLEKVANIQFAGDRGIERGGTRRASDYFDNPNPYRYLVFPSAFTIERGEWLYQNTYLFLNSFGVGITDNFSVSGGFEFASLLAGIPAFYIAPKVNFAATENFRIGVGGVYAGIFNDGAEGGGAVYAMGTLGDRNRNLTFGLGYALEAEISSVPLLTLSGMIRVSRRLALVSENWILPSEPNANLFSLGFRIMGEQIAGDLALLSLPITLFGDEGRIPLPYLSLAVRL